MRLGLRGRIIAGGVAGFTVLAVCLNIVSYRDGRKQALSLYQEKARSVVLAAESAREEMARKWDQGLFTQQQLREWANAGETEKILAAVPVVTAWRTSMD